MVRGKVAELIIAAESIGGVKPYRNGDEMVFEKKCHDLNEAVQYEGEHRPYG